MNIHKAASRGNVARVKYLLNRGEDVNKRDIRGRYFEETPLEKAIKAGQVGVARLLLERGAAIDARNVHQLTPLHHASSEDLKMVRLLVEHGADIEARDYRGKTSLHRAVKFDNYPAVRYLVEQGANIHAQDDRGNTPLHISIFMVRHSKKRTNAKNIFRFLILQGADPTIKRIYGESVYSLARNFGLSGLVDTWLYERWMTLHTIGRWSNPGANGTLPNSVKRLILSKTNVSTPSLKREVATKRKRNENEAKKANAMARQRKKHARAKK